MDLYNHGGMPPKKQLAFSKLEGKKKKIESIQTKREISPVDWNK